MFEVTDVQTYAGSRAYAAAFIDHGEAFLPPSLSPFPISPLGAQSMCEADFHNGLRYSGTISLLALRPLAAHLPALDYLGAVVTIPPTPWSKKSGEATSAAPPSRPPPPPRDTPADLRAFLDGVFLLVLRRLVAY